MVVRWIVGNWLRQQVHAKVTEAVTEAARRSAEQGLPEEVARCDIGVLCALGVEASALVDRLENVVSLQGQGFTVHTGVIHQHRIVVVRSGPGQSAAAQATSALIAGHRPPWIISAGFAGGLRDELSRDDFVMPGALVNEGGDVLRVDLQLGTQSESAPRVHGGRLLMVDRIVSTPQEKRDLGRRHDAVAVDMESYAVAEVCQREKVRFLAVRAVSDAVDERLPPDLEKLMKPQSLARRAGAVTGAVVRRPGSVKDLWKLKTSAWQTADRLGQFLTGVLEQLPE
jgi:adenosylhomocysteine nucleosidase